MIVTHAAAVRPYQGLSSCGDAAVHVMSGARHRFVIIDALGHGPDAEKTAQRLSALIHETSDLETPEVFARCDAALTGTTLRGAAMGVLDVEVGGAWFAGVGNIDVYGPKGAKRPVCTPGTLGRRAPRVRALKVEIEAGSRWVLVSDGLRQRDLQAAMLAASGLPPGEAATQLIATAARLDDDSSIWVVDFGALQ